MAGPLEGVRVVDLSTVIAGPYATQMLGEMGAEIIKIEPPAGDIMRAPGPGRSPGMGATFLNCNRNKRSLTLDLKDPAELAELLGLIAGADVFVHNMRMAAALRLGLGQEALLARNPRLIYCAIVGFGQDGPYRDRPAYDDIVQAAAGWAGLQARVDREPRYAPTIVADKTTALFAVGAINAALYHRAGSGRGQAIEVPMFEAMVSFLSVEHLSGLTYRPPLGESGYGRTLSPNRRPYRTQDGYIAAMPYTAAHWRAFFRAAGRDDWAAEEALGSDTARAGMIDELYARLASCFATLPTAEWLALLQPLDVPCAPVNSIEDLLDDPHLRAVGFFEETHHPSEGAIISPRHPVRFSGTPCTAGLPAPELPRHRKS